MSFLFVSWVLSVIVTCPVIGQSPEIPEEDRKILLAKVKEQIVSILGTPPSTGRVPPTPPTSLQGSIQRSIQKRHSKRRQNHPEDNSQVLLFPSSDVLSETPNSDAFQQSGENSFTYVFHPSPHVRSRRVSASQFWFYTGSGTGEEPPVLGKNMKTTPEVPFLQTSPSSGERSSRLVLNSTNEEVLPPTVDLQVLSEHEPVTVALSKVQHVDNWTVFHLAPAFLNYVTKEIFVLLVHCPLCPCSDRAEYTPFIMFNTHPDQRNRRSTLPWSPSALELLQRPPSSGAGNENCHRASLNISFEELGWDQWIVHPGSFQFHYCHGTCSPNQDLAPALHWGHCCAALPSTMKPLRVTTTTDGGFSYRYETVPNLLTQDCACS
ncbi:hypothetical protein GDO86_018443 [Hymenochirus boettgeri]|uniref:Inhibin alpha chain n=1 Tax=Hymenochirus boettgeri TaxID=247094 RepID=A0A8T2IKC0_9PIPI|nr:hypothetical protein GDO86_018443 [Hymenochirus boettgeri]